MIERVSLGGSGKWRACCQEWLAAVEKEKIKLDFAIPLGTILASLLVSEFYSNLYWGWCPQKNYRTAPKPG